MNEQTNAEEFSRSLDAWYEQRQRARAARQVVDMYADEPPDTPGERLALVEALLVVGESLGISGA